MGRDGRGEADDIFFNQRQRQGQGVLFHPTTVPGMETCPGKGQSMLLLLQIEGRGKAQSTSSGRVCCLFSFETCSSGNSLSDL